MRTLQPANRVRVGVLAIAIVVLVVGVGQSFGSLPMLFATAHYYAQFTDSGGLSKGDKVRIVGMDIGTVQDVAIDGDHALMTFTTGTRRIGTESRLAIRTDTLLGKKVLEIEPHGHTPLRPNGLLPLGQSTTPYQVYDAFFDVTKAAAGWNIDTVKESLKVLSQTVNQTSPHLSAALDGVAKFSDIIGKRDDELKHLVTEARKVAGVLGDRSKQINALLRNTQSLLAAFNQRGKAIEALLANVSAFAVQVQGLIHDNPNLHHLLEQLRSVTDVLVEHKNDLVSVLNTLRNYTAALSEAVGSGPYFKVMIANLLPYQILQPWVDTAFKKRGVDPEDFWRSAGLPAFRFPDPNGTRLPNGAPPPAPRVLEGTPDHPGPAVAPGTPCSYAPSRDLLPRPGNPMPCATLDQGQGPFGPNGPYPALPDVASSPPNPNGLPPAPGIPIAGHPGTPAPNVPGTPVPLPPKAPPGARTEAVQPGGPPPVFAPAFPPGPLPPGPIAPPGPGPQLPVPFVTPGGNGG
jgi:phospholipid/cholesterol/gamma-HCH transport system substrate-binding protein